LIPCCKSMDEFHPPTCQIIWGCGIRIMTIYQLYYNQCSIGTCHVIEEGYENLYFWLLFNYIITNGTLTHVIGHSWSTIKQNYLMCAMCKILKLLIYWKCQHMILCHLDTYVTHLYDIWHLVVCRPSNICEVKPK